MTSRWDRKGDSEPLYTLFVREYGRSLFDPFSIEHLPIYDKEEDAPTPYEEFLAYLRENKKVFLTFNDNTKSKFYSTIESYGIIKKDWEQLVDINQYEGGVTYYFNDKNATTNHGLFSKMIIPAIEARLSESGEENDLITLFKNIASITKNLPELKKNAASYAEIKSHNDELASSLVELIKEKKKFKRHVERGHSLLTAISHEMSELEKDRTDHQDQLDKLIDHKQNLQWKQQNLQYVVKHYELQDSMETLHSYKEQLAESGQKKEQYIVERELAELHLRIKKWDELHQEAEVFRRKIETIKEAEEFRQSKKAQDLLEDEIDRKWSAVCLEICRIAMESTAYRNYLGEARKSGNDKVESLKKKQNKYEIEHGVHEEFVKKFESDLENEKKVYGEYFYFRIDEIHSERTKLYEQEAKKITELMEVQKKRTEDRVRLLNKQATLNAEIQSVDKEAKRVQKKWNGQKEKEDLLLHKGWKALRTVSSECKDFQGWMDEKIPIFTSKKKEWEMNLNQLSLEWYEIAFQASQKEKRFLIPNEEVYKVKSLLEERGIPVLFGDEYIKRHEPEKREELNRKHPLLKYGLLVLHQEHPYMNEIKKLDKTFLHSPVPIFSVNRLEMESDMQFLLLDGRARELSVHDEKLTAHKHALHEKSEEIREGIDYANSYVEELRSIIAELEAFDRSASSVLLEKQYRNLETERNLKIKNREEFEQREKALSEELATGSDKIEELGQLLQNLKVEIARLEHWLENSKDYEKRKQRQSDLALVISRLDTEINNNIDGLQLLDQEWDAFNVARQDWESKKNGLMNAVKEVLPRSSIDIINTEDLLDSPPDFSMGDEELMADIYKWKTVQQKMQELDIELARLDATLQEKQRYLNEKEEELTSLAEEWRTLRVPRELISVLEASLMTAKRHTKEIEDTILRLETTIENEVKHSDRLGHELKELRATNDREYRRKPEIWQEGDFEKMKVEFRQALEETRKDIQDSNLIIVELGKKLEKLASANKDVEPRLDMLNSAYERMRDSYWQKRVKKEPDRVSEEWVRAFKSMKTNMERGKQEVQSTLRKKRKIFESSNWAAEIKDVALKVYSDMDFEDADEAMESIVGLNLLANNEITEAEEERNTAEEAKQEWVDHACKYALQIVEHLRKMIRAMRIRNRNGFDFPLVKLKRDNMLPRDTEQIEGAISDLFDKVITEIFSDYQDMKDIPHKVFKEKISTKNIIFAALNYHYPTLWLYRLHEENSFLYEPSKEEFYTEWETINESSKTDPSGSGGQLFSARTLIMMMLTSFKRTNEDNSNWKLLITDNPFSVAVSDHIVDPILAVAEELKFQWIVVTPPELVKVELLQKFDVCYQLSAKEIASGIDQVVSEVQAGQRSYKKSNSILKEDKLFVISEQR